MAGLGLRRRVDAELVAHERSAALIHAQRLRPVARPRLCAHELPVRGLPERLERNQLLCHPNRDPPLLSHQCGVGPDVQRTHQHRAELRAAVLDPESVISREERPASKTGHILRPGASARHLRCGQGSIRIVDTPGGLLYVHPDVVRREPVAPATTRRQPRPRHARLRQRGTQPAHDRRERRLPSPRQGVRP
jgi:hypothetical protein